MSNSDRSTTPKTPAPDGYFWDAVQDERGRTICWHLYSDSEAHKDIRTATAFVLLNRSHCTPYLFDSDGKTQPPKVSYLNPDEARNWVNSAVMSGKAADRPA